MYRTEGYEDQRQVPLNAIWLHKKSISGTEKFRVWNVQNQIGDSSLVQSKDTKTIYINSIRNINLLCLTHFPW